MISQKFKLHGSIAFGTLLLFKSVSGQTAVAETDSAPVTQDSGSTAVLTVDLSSGLEAVKEDFEQQKAILSAEMSSLIDQGA